jgi:hypothetical protein
MGCLAAAVLNFAIAPFTLVWMTPNNFALIEMNEEKRETRGEKSIQEGQYSVGQRNADEYIGGKDDRNQFTDLSGQQPKAPRELTVEGNEEV